MINPAIARQFPPHLFSAVIACALPIAILGGGRLLAVYLEEKTIHATAPRDFFIKNQGLDLYEEREYVTTIVADRFREDLSDAGYGNGRHAFRVQTPPQFKDGRPHVLSISVTGTTKKITPTPRIILCPGTGR